MYAGELVGASGPVHVEIPTTAWTAASVAPNFDHCGVLTASGGVKIT